MAIYKGYCTRTCDKKKLSAFGTLVLSIDRVLQRMPDNCPNCGNVLFWVKNDKETRHHASWSEKKHRNALVFS